MMGWCPGCYIPSFVEIGPPVREKIFEGFLPYMGVVAVLVMWHTCREQNFATYQVLWKSVPRFRRRFFKGFYHIGAWRAILVMWPASCNQIFHFLVPESFHTKFGSDWHSSFWENLIWIFVCTWPWAKIKKWPWPSILIYLHKFN